jgi:hypothetical protein
MNITWNFQAEPGAINGSFNARAIFSAMDKITRYWAVNFIQVGSRPYMSFVLTNRNRNASWAAYTSGRTIYIPASFKYQSFDQLAYVLLHEMGHVFGGGSHAPGTQHIMSPTISDIYKNFTQLDYQWFRLPIRPATQVPRAWNEPNKWRPASNYPMPTGHESEYLKILAGFDAEGAANLGYQPCQIGCGSSLWDYIYNALTKKQVKLI